MMFFRDLVELFSDMSEKRHNIISESLKFRGAIYRILKIHETISPLKITLTMHFNLIDIMLWQVPLKFIC